jgi:hypothetical protein
VQMCGRGVHAGPSRRPANRESAPVLRSQELRLVAATSQHLHGTPFFPFCTWSPRTTSGIRSDPGGPGNLLVDRITDRFTRFTKTSTGGPVVIPPSSRSRTVCQDTSTPCANRAVATMSNAADRPSTAGRCHR